MDMGLELLAPLLAMLLLLQPGRGEGRR